MIRDAEEHAAEDRRRREEIDARNELDTPRTASSNSSTRLRTPAVHEKARAEQVVADAWQALRQQAAWTRAAR